MSGLVSNLISHMPASSVAAVVPLREVARGDGGFGGNLIAWIGAGAIGFGIAAMLGIAWWMMRGSLMSKGASTTRGGQADHQQAAELASLLRELTAELDAKADRLERLLEHAERLEARGQAGAARPGPGAWAGAGAGAGGGFAGAGDRKAGEPAMVSEGARAAGGETGDEFSRKVYQLADQGRSPVEIAQALGSQIGKIELLLSLRGMRRGR